MTKFVWFFGASGAGKATLIKEIAAERFVIPNLKGKFVVCSESMEWGREQRLAMLEKQLERYTLSNSTVLIKGQASDLTTSCIPYNLKEEMPEVKQQIVFVYTKPKLLTARTANRRDTYWPNPAHDFALETAHQISEVKKLSVALDVSPTIVDNSAGQAVVKFGARIDSLYTVY